MDNLAIGRNGLRPPPGLLTGQGLALLCWIAVVALGYVAWRRRRGDDVCDLLIVSGLWLAVRLGLLVAGLPESGQPGGDWLATALDLIGLILLAWPFLAPPLATHWADRLAGIGLVAVALACGVSLWQRVRGALGLTPTLRFTLTWAHSALALAGLAALNLLHVQTRKRAWLLTTAGALAGGISGLLIPRIGIRPLPVPAALSPALTAATATLAAAWLNWMEHQTTKPVGTARPAVGTARPAVRTARPAVGTARPAVRTARSIAPARRGGGAYPDPRMASRLLEASGSLLVAADLAQLLKAATAALSQVLEVRAAAFMLAEYDTAENNGTLDLRTVARWPHLDGVDAFSRLPLELGTHRANALRRGLAVHMTGETDERQLQSLGSTLGAELEAALILPLLPPSSRQKAGGENRLLVVSHGGAPLNASQLHVCRLLANQVAIATSYIQLRAKMGQQSRAMARLILRQEHSAGRSRAILESIADGIIISDADDQVILTNRAALDILGMERPDVVGSPFGQIMGCMVPAGDLGIIGRLTDVSPYRMEAVFEISDRVVQMSMAPIENNEGTQLGVVAVLRDVTALTNAEAERERLLAELQEHSQKLEQATDRLRELDRLKSQLIANMSHELRTPLNSIIGFSGVMLKEIDGQLTEPQREDMEAIYTSGKHLLGLITDILDISQLWAGKMDLKLHDVDLREIIADAVTITAPLAGDKSIELVQALDPDLPAIRADKTRLRQVLLNLLTNAIKYTEQGHITVSASRDGDYCIVSVADTGIGISPKHMETIFQEFGRVDNSSTRKAGGLGLGLAISRQLIELQGGQIWVESKVGVGSTFHFSLPIEGPPSTTDGKITHRRLEAALVRWKN